MSIPELTIHSAGSERRTRMQNANRFKLGLFGMNCSGSMATTASECWTATWQDNRAAAQMADAAGIEFLLPIDDGSAMAAALTGRGRALKRCPGHLRCWRRQRTS